MIQTVFTEDQFLRKFNSQIVTEGIPWERHYARGAIRKNLEAFNIYLRGKALALQIKLKYFFQAKSKTDLVTHVF